MPSRSEIIREFQALPNNARLKEIDVASILLCSVAKLQRDRVFGGGIPFIRDGGKLSTDKNGMTRIFGGRVYYLKKDVAEYLATNSRTVANTTEASEIFRAENSALGA